MREPNRFHYSPSSTRACGDEIKLVGQNTSDMKRQLIFTTAPMPRGSSVSIKCYQILVNIMTKKLRYTNNIGKFKNRAGSSSCQYASQVTPMQLALLTLLSLSAFHHVLAGTSTSSNQISNLQQKSSAEQLPAQARAGGLDPSDYVDEAGELDVLLGQQQIPTAQLMAAAGHIVPDNFFLPGGSIPANVMLQQQLLQQQQQLLQQQQQQQAQQSHSNQNQQQQNQNHQQQQNHQDALQQAAASQVHSRVVSAPSRAAGQAGRGQLAPLDLLMAAAEQHQLANDGQMAALIDQNGYAMTTQPDPRDAAAQMDLLDFLTAPQALSNQQVAHLAALYDQQLAQQQHRHQQQQQQNHHHHHHQQQHQNQHHQQQHANLVDQMTALASELQQQQQQQEQTAGDNEHQVGPMIGLGSAIGPDYQLIPADYSPNSIYDGPVKGNGGGLSGEQQYNMNQQHQHHQPQQHRPYGLPTKSSNKEPPGMLKPLGHPKTVSSPIIDLAANNLPKNTGLEKLADKIPHHQTPTVFSFASSKDPSEKVKGVNQKKRTVMRQAEQIARMMIKSFNDKFGTNLGDQTDIPFLLSSLGPLGFAQNILLDPTLLVSLLNTAEKTYLSDVLPGPAKQVVRPVLNLFRVPNKKRGDKANLSNIISYLASGGQTAANVPSKHRQGLGIEKSSLDKSKSRR